MGNIVYTLFTLAILMIKASIEEVETIHGFYNSSPNYRFNVDSNLIKVHICDKIGSEKLIKMPFEKSYSELAFLITRNYLEFLKYSKKISFFLSIFKQNMIVKKCIFLFKIENFKKNSAERVQIIKESDDFMKITRFVTLSNYAEKEIKELNNDLKNIIKSFYKLHEINFSKDSEIKKILLNVKKHHDSIIQTVFSQKKTNFLTNKTN